MKSKQKELHAYIKFFRVYPQIVQTVSALLQSIIFENIKIVGILGTISPLFRLSEKRKGKIIQKIYGKSFMIRLKNDRMHGSSTDSIPAMPLLRKHTLVGFSFYTAYLRTLSAMLRCRGVFFFQWRAYEV